ncbi:MAG: hypothetical protein JW904_04855 [Spirochaetales bacterium]|nr:hypothetical protein [Spirochaetales bacterium]
MVHVHLNERNNGACPLCQRRLDCGIISEITKACEKKAKPLNDEEMEVVIYRCPMFKEE